MHDGDAIAGLTALLIGASLITVITRAGPRMGGGAPLVTRAGDPGSRVLAAALVGTRGEPAQVTEIGSLFQRFCASRSALLSAADLPRFVLLAALLWRVLAR